MLLGGIGGREVIERCEEKQAEGEALEWDEEQKEGRRSNKTE